MATEGVVPCRTSSTTSRQIDLESLQNPTRRETVGNIVTSRLRKSKVEYSCGEQQGSISRKYTIQRVQEDRKCEENRLIKIGRWCSEVKLINDDTSSRLGIALSDVAASSIQSVITEISRATVSINSMHP
ncbi:LOW QUALITY PROTEIN: Krueppel-like factor 3 isoform X3, partial [Vespula squamosa]